MWVCVKGSDPTIETAGFRQRYTILSLPSDFISRIAEIDLLFPPREFITSVLQAFCEGFGFAFGAAVTVDGNIRVDMVCVYNLPKEQTGIIATPGEPLLSGPAGEALRVGHAVIVKNIETEPGLAPWHDLARRNNIRTAAFIPLINNKTMLGTYILYHTGLREITDAELDDFRLIGAMMAVAVRADKYFEKMEATRKLLQAEIREHGKTREALGITEIKYRTLADEIGDGLYVTDTAGNITYSNRTLAAMLGYENPENLVGRSFEAFIKRESPSAMADDFHQRLGRAGHGHTREMILTRPDGNEITVQLKRTPVVTDGGSVGIRGLVRDVTDRHRAMQAYIEGEAHLRSTMEAASGFAVYRLAQDKTQPLGLRVVFVSPSLSEILDVSEKMKFEKWFERIHPDDFERATKAHFEAFETTNYNQTVRVYHPAKGQWRWIQAISNGLFGTDGLTYVNGIIIDVTEKKAAESDLLDYQDRLRKMGAELRLTEERERRQIAMELHDHIGQTLAAAKIKTKTYRQTCGQAEFAGFLDEMVTLLDQMIVDTRSLTTQVSPPILYELGLIPALEWLCEDFQSKYGLDMEMAVGNDLALVPLDCSFTVFSTIRELLYNVVKHARADHCLVAAWNDGDHICFAVQDDGVGFSGDLGSNYYLKGTGFGLFSIRERLRSLGGSFVINSEKDGWTCATLTVPSPSGDQD